MDKLILSDEILDRQICTECLNYLSVGPVMVTRRGNILCGSCTNKQITPKFAVPSLYNLLAEELVFKCINYYGGCEEPLLFNEAKDHEKTCKKKNFKCPFCHLKLNGCQLVQHLDRAHPGDGAKEGIFKINAKETFSRNIVIVRKRIIFCLIISKKDDNMKFFNVLVTPADLGPKQFRLRFFKSGTNVEFVTAPLRISHKLENFPFPLMNDLLEDIIDGKVNSNQTKNSLLLNQMLFRAYLPYEWYSCKIELIGDNNRNDEEKLTKLNYLEKIYNKKTNPVLQVHFNTATNMLEANMSDPNECNYDINRVLKMAPAELRQFVNTELYLMQNCINCDKYITTSIFFCPKYHMSCIDCRNSSCHKCRSRGHWSVQPKFNISLPCEWKGCRRCPDIFNYMTHKRDCTSRRYRCPDRECQCEGYPNCRWHMHPFVDSAALNLSCKSQSIYWRNNYKELFYIRTKYNPLSGELYMTIEEVDVVMSRRYQFLVRYSVNGGLYPNGMSHTIRFNRGTSDKFVNVILIVRECPITVSCAFE